MTHAPDKKALEKAIDHAALHIAYELKGKWTKQNGEKDTEKVKRIWRTMCRYALSEEQSAEKLDAEALKRDADLWQSQRYSGGWTLHDYIDHLAAHPQLFKGE